MIFLTIAFAALILWTLRRHWPVQGLIELENPDQGEAQSSGPTMKMLDVRDASLYLTGHIPGSLNISTGRLPYVWHQSLSPEDEVTILSDSKYQIKKAARILKKQGFRHLYAWHGIRTEDQTRLA